MIAVPVLASLTAWLNPLVDFALPTLLEPVRPEDLRKRAPGRQVDSASSFVARLTASVSPYGPAGDGDEMEPLRNVEE